MYTVIIFAVLMGFFKAVMDKTGDPVAFRRSIFSKMNPNFWEKTAASKVVKFLPFTKYRPDAWHLAGTGLIGSAGMMAGIAATLSLTLLQGILAGVTLASIVTLAFNVFYNHILARK